MTIKITNGRVKINEDIKEVGCNLKMDAAEEARLIKLGIAEEIDETEEVEIIEQVGE